MKTLYTSKPSLLLLSFVLLISCNNATDNKESKLLTNTAKNGIKDSSIMPKSGAANDLSKYVEEYKKSYDQKEAVDSSFLFKGDTIHLVLKHNCLYDRSINVPQKYTAVYGLDRFITHAFQSNLVIKKNGIKIVDRIISKADFNKFLDTSLMNYSALLHPTIRISRNEIQIGYSISIPLTDVGIAVHASPDEDGIITFREDK